MNVFKRKCTFSCTCDGGNVNHVLSRIVSLNVGFAKFLGGGHPLFRKSFVIIYLMINVGDVREELNLLKQFILLDLIFDVDGNQT